MRAIVLRRSYSDARALLASACVRCHHACLPQLWPGTTVAHLVDTLKAPPHSRVNGDLVQAKALRLRWWCTTPAAVSVSDGSGGAAGVDGGGDHDTWREVAPDEALGPGCWVVALGMSRRATQAWQEEGKAKAGGGTRDGAKLPSVQFGDLRSKNRKQK
jgi:hypothetical protein